MKKLTKIGLLGTLLLTACTFDNSSGQFSFDLNNPDSQRGVNTFAGVYQTKPMGNGQRYEEMQIKPLGNERYQIMITTPNVANGCQFSSTATMTNGKLLIPLSEQNARLRSTMKIAIVGDKAVVDTTHPENFNDLKAFCGSGSLVGGYYKVL